MPIVHNPPTIAAPAGRYSHGMELAPGARTLYVSGQIGADKDGLVPATTADQARNAWSNIVEILKSASMGPGDIVKMTTFLTDANDAGISAEARRTVLGDHMPASTLVVVAALMRPDWKIEIEVVAARAP